MLRYIFTFICMTLVSVLTSYAQFREGVSYGEINDSENVASFKSHVRYLSSAMLEGRKAGSEGERLAAEYVAEQLKGYGVDVLSMPSGDTFGIKKENGDTLTSRNVVGFIQGYDKTLRDHYIVIGARLDNLGTMTMTIDGKKTERIYYGANGNASGLAMMLELARMFQTNSVLLRRSVLFVAFGASNESFAGSWYFLNRSFKDAPFIDAMVNLDMLGTGYNGFYAYTSSNADMNDLLRTISEDLQPIVPQTVAVEPYPSDHRAFYASEIPSVLFTTGRFPERNTERDTQSIIDYETMERELEFIYNFAIYLTNYDGPLAFRHSDMKSAGAAYDDVVPYYECDQKPLFLNSADPRVFIEKWVYQYLKYPESAVRNGIQGRVMVEFVIGKDGNVTDVRVVKGVSEELDAEAIKVVSASPKWKPAKVNGNKVRSSMTIPVEFRLEKRR